MQMSLTKGRRDFTDRLIHYAVKAGVLAKCPDHPGSIYRSAQDVQAAHNVVEAAWRIGEISSGLDGAISQLNAIIEKAPSCCSQKDCWSKP